MSDQKSVKAKDLRGNDPDELRSSAKKLVEELFQSKLKKATNQLENTMLIRKARRDIARINTVLGERLRQSPIGASSASTASSKEK